MTLPERDFFSESSKRWMVPRVKLLREVNQCPAKSDVSNRVRRYCATSRLKVSFSGDNQVSSSVPIDVPTVPTKKNGLQQNCCNPLILLAERTGLEPATPGVTGRYSNQLNYHSW
jgi:hypothetical protein